MSGATYYDGIGGEKMSEFYFTTSATECEHTFIESLLEEFCRVNDFELVYYRKFKNGHVPMQREIKIKGKSRNLIYAKLIEWNEHEDRGGCSIEIKNYHQKLR